MEQINNFFYLSIFTVVICFAVVHKDHSLYQLVYGHLWTSGVKMPESISVGMVEGSCLT